MLKDSVIAVAVALAFLCGTSAIGQVTTAKKSPAGVAIAQSAVAAMKDSGSSGGVQPRGIALKGTTTYYGTTSVDFPTTIKIRSSRQCRVEVTRPSGTDLIVINHYLGYRKKGTEKAVQLPGPTTEYRRCDYVPFYSLISEYAAIDVEIDALGSASINNEAADLIRLVDRHGGKGNTTSEDAAAQQFVIGRTKKQVLKLSYNEHSFLPFGGSVKLDIFYGDYRVVNGLWVPFLRVAFAEGKLQSKLVLDSVDTDSVLSDSDFEIPAEVRSAK